MYGYQAVFSKVAVDDFVDGGVLGLVTSWQLWAMLLAATAGTAFNASSTTLSNQAAATVAFALSV